MKLATPLGVLLAVLSPAVAVLGQASGGVQTGDSSPLRHLWMLRLDTLAKWEDDLAVLSPGDSATMKRPADGGLWLSGDTAVGFAHLQWIAGQQSPGVLKMDRNGRVAINAKELTRALGISAGNDSLDRRRLGSFVASDEGLLLLAQITGGPHRYLLHIGPTAPTLGGDVRVRSVINLDNRYDSRINPRRQAGQKLNSERPPEGFDVVIAINPGVSWFNPHSKQFMPAAQILFHELAESHARLVLGLDYLPDGDKPGAHDVAIEREIQLKQERPERSVVMPIGEYVVQVAHHD